MNYRQKLGHWGEAVACRFLRQRGFAVIERNYHCREGEIDVVACRDGELWFVEVKARTSAVCGEPEEAVDEAKIEKMMEAALSYLAAKGLEAPWQLGLVAIKRVRGKVWVSWLII